MGEYKRKFNVMDHFLGKSMEEIRNELRASAFPYAVAMENWEGDFNFGTLVRNANAFNALEVFYIGKRRWDRRGAVGTHNYVDMTYIPTIEEIKPLKEKYTFIAIDNHISRSPIPLRNFSWPEYPLIIFGSESNGISNELLNICDAYVKIEQYGSVRSLNCGTASGIVMYDYVSKFNSNT